MEYYKAMNEHISFGVIPVRRTEQGWEFFLVQHHTGNWSFPKGHQEAGESGEQTARRELTEETGIQDVDLHLAEPFVEEYTWEQKGKNNHKVATYYLGLVGDHVITIQQKELNDGRWIPAQEAEEVLTFAAGQAILRRALKYLNQNNLWT